MFTKPLRPAHVRDAERRIPGHDNDWDFLTFDVTPEETADAERRAAEWAAQSGGIPAEIDFLTNR
ncbi:hypothetical protein SEA_WALTZ_38 [Arthrobacter phage Waltz]|nr:hypothetical protein SEA_WALTZ_38 [Arthrobacter phage Waltz]